MLAKVEKITRYKEPKLKLFQTLFYQTFFTQGADDHVRSFTASVKYAGDVFIIMELETKDRHRK